MASEEVHHKMSKKIAQLTKVIFHLHSKNEENSQYSAALTNAYEKEVEQILRDSNDIIKRQKEALDKAKESNNVADQLREIQERHEAEKRESQKAFDEYKRVVASKEQNMEKEYQGKNQEMKLEVMDLKKKFDGRCDDFRKQMTDFKKNNEAMDEIKRAHAKELAAHVQEHNKKYSELQCEMLN
jgi:hypothetical protein